MDTALNSEFLWEVRDPGSQSEVYPPTSVAFEFAFERSCASRNDLKLLIHQVREIFLTADWQAVGQLGSQRVSWLLYHLGVYEKEMIEGVWGKNEGEGNGQRFIITIFV